MRTKLVMHVSLIVMLSGPAWAQSGAPNLVPIRDRLVDSMGQPITSPSQIRLRVIQGGTADEVPTTGRVVFEEQVEVTPDEEGFFEQVIGSEDRQVGTGRVRFTPEDLNTTRPVFIEIALVGQEKSGDSRVEVMLPRQRLLSVGYALQAADAAVDDRFVNVDGDTMTGPLEIEASLRVGPAGLGLGSGDVFIAGDLQVGAGSFLVFGSKKGEVRMDIPGTPADKIGLGITIQGASFFTPSTPIAILGLASSGNGVRGDSSSGVGVSGFSVSSDGVRGFSVSGDGVEGGSPLGFGVSGSSAGGVGVEGRSTSGVGVEGRSTSGDIFQGFGGNTLQFQVKNNGDVFVSGMMVHASDARLKTNVRPLGNVLEKLQEIRGVSFQRTDAPAPPEGAPVPRHIGVIAQEVEAVFPQLVTTAGDDGYKAVAYGRLTAVLIEAVKELQAQNNELRARLEMLEQMHLEPRAGGQ